MNYPIPHIRLQYFLNPAATPTASYSETQEQILGGDAYSQAEAAIASWPGYAPTPLCDLPGLSHAAGVARLVIKKTIKTKMLHGSPVTQVPGVISLNRIFHKGQAVT